MADRQCNHNIKLTFVKNTKNSRVERRLWKYEVRKRRRRKVVQIVQHCPSSIHPLLKSPFSEKKISLASHFAYRPLLFLPINNLLVSLIFSALISLLYPRSSVDHHLASCNIQYHLPPSYTLQQVLRVTTFLSTCKKLFKQSFLDYKGDFYLSEWQPHAHFLYPHLYHCH